MHDADNHVQQKSPPTVPIGFTFVEQAPSQPSREFRRQVRSHIARLQHSRTKATGHKRSSQSRRQRHEASRTQHVTPTTVGLARKDPLEKEDDAEPELEMVLKLLAPHILPQTATAKALSHGTLAFRTFALADVDHEISRCLNILELNMDSITSRYKVIVQFQSRDFEMNSTFERPVVIWKRFFDFIFADPILLTTAILLTSRHLYHLQDKPFVGKQLIALITLEQLLVRRINKALSKGIRGVSDHMLVTVAFCAAYEIIHGSRAAYEVHMSALVQMIFLRGGLAAIGAHDPYLERMLVWHDMNTSTLAQCKPYLEDMDNYPTSARPQPDPSMFRLRQRRIVG